MSRNSTPRARPADELIVEELPNELLVYDIKRSRAHCLNASAAAVFRSCDGKSSIREIARRAGVEEKVVELAVDELSAAQLLEESDHAPSYLRTSRRRALKKMAMIAGAAVVIPMVQSIVAPSVAEASSCAPSGAACTSNAQCCSHSCGFGQPGRCD